MPKEKKPDSRNGKERPCIITINTTININSGNDSGGSICQATAVEEVLELLNHMVGDMTAIKLLRPPIT